MTTPRLPVFASLAAAVVAGLFVAGCPAQNEEPLTLAEATQALEEAALSGQAQSLIGGTIELSTNFTIGAAVEAAANELRTYVSSQLPCAEITLEDNTLTVEYGAKAGNCIYRGQSYSGTHSVTVRANGQGQVIVEHGWDGLTNGVVSATGSATVTWDGVDVSRRVQHEITWTRLSDGRQGTGSGDRVQRPLPGGLVEGIQVDGSQFWSGQAGTWDLSIDGVQARWIDPVPQAGTYSLLTPDDRSVVLSFARVDADTIAVTLEGPKRTWRFEVSQLGAIAAAD